MSNIIRTQGDLTGNIGSCKVQETSVQTANYFWKTETTVILTNSCSGEIIKESTYPNYPLAPYGAGLILFFIMLFALYIVYLLDKNK